MEKVYIAHAPSAVHLGNCFLGASYSRSEAKRMAGRAGFVTECANLDDAIETFPYWDEEIMLEL